MKQRISIFISLLAVCLLLSTLMACAPATPPIDDTPVPTPDTTEPDIDTPIDSSVPEQNVTPTPDQPDEPDAPDEPTIPDEPIEDYELPSIYHIQDAAPMIYRSLDDMLSDLTNESTKHENNSNFELFGLDQVQSLYVPAFERDDYRLHFVEMKGDSAKYYYVPSECDAQTADLYLNSISIIVTIVDLMQHPSSTPEGMVASGRFEWNEEGYAYSQVYRQVAFAVENAGIVIRVPNHMNDYNTIRSLCKVQRTIIDPTHVTE